MIAQAVLAVGVAAFFHYRYNNKPDSTSANQPEFSPADSANSERASSVQGHTEQDQVGSAPPSEEDHPLIKIPKPTKQLADNYDCATRCSRLTQGDRDVIAETLKQVGCDGTNPGHHVLCATTPEQICVGACGGKQQDMRTWLPGAFAGPSALTAKEQRNRLKGAFESYWRCAERCSREGVLVDARAADAQQKATETLERCGVVQLADGYDEQLLDRTQLAIDAIKADAKAYKKLEDRKQLHDGRWQLYLPFSEPFTNRTVLGATDLVIDILAGYFGKNGFGIDHVSVLVSSPGSGNQSLHPDVMSFTRLSMSVHTALEDITRDMGPTFFCPCTGEKEDMSAWVGSATVKMTNLLNKVCAGPSFAPKFVKRGTITIYDAATFHMGLENGSEKDRPVLKLEVGADGYPVKRNYLDMAPKEGKKQARLFRGSLGPPRMGQ